MSDLVEKVWVALNGWSGRAASERAIQAVLDDIREWAMTECPPGHEYFLPLLDAYEKEKMK